MASLGSIDFDLGVKIRQSQFNSANDNLRRMQKQIGGVGKDAIKMNRNFQTAARGMVGATRRIGRSMTSLRRRVFSLKGALIGLGVGLVAKGFLDVARETENLKIQLKFLTDNADDAASAFRQMNKFASEVPFTLREIQAGGASLLTVTDNVDDLNEIMTLTADIAAATGLSFEVTAQQIQRSFSAGIGSADLFREKAVGAMLGFEQGVKISAEATRDHIINAFRDGTTSMRGAAAEMATTFDGTMSQISDKWFQFRRAFMDSAPFDFIKSSFILLNKNLDKSFSSIEDAGATMGDKFIEVFKKIILGVAGFADFISPIVSGIARTINVLVTLFNDMPGWMQQSGIIAGILFGRKGIAALAIIGTVNKGLNEIGGAFDRLIDKGVGIFGFEFTTQEEFNKAQAELNAAAENVKKISIPLALVPADNLTFTELAHKVIAEIEGETTRRKLKIEITTDISGDTKAGTAVAEALKAQQRAVQDINFGDAIQQLQEFFGAEVKVTSAGQAMMDMFAEGRGVIAANVTEIQQYEKDLARLAELQDVGAINAEQMTTAQERLRDAMRLDADIVDPLREYNDAIERLNALHEAGVINAIEMADAIGKINQNALKTGAVMGEVINQLANFSDPLVDALFDGENAFEALKQTAVNALKEIIKQMIKTLIIKKLLEGIGFAIGGPVGSVFGSAAASIATGDTGGTFKQPFVSNVPELIIPGLGSSVTGIPLVNGQSFEERLQSLFQTGLVPNLDKGGFSKEPFFSGNPELIVPGGDGASAFPADMIRNMMATGNTTNVTNKNDNSVTIVQDFRNVKGSKEIQDVVMKAMREAAPLIVDASVSKVQDERRANPNFFGGLN